MYGAFIEGGVIMVSQKEKRNNDWLRMPSKSELVVIVFVLIVSGFATYQLEMTLKEKNQIVVEQEQFIEIMNHTNAAFAEWRARLIEREHIVELREQKIDDSKQVINHRMSHGLMRL